MYIEECCLDAGSYILECRSESGYGWSGGFIEILGTQYCEDFISGMINGYIQITVEESGKYRFGIVNIVE